jgi:hypothetical protein
MDHRCLRLGHRAMGVVSGVIDGFEGQQGPAARARAGERWMKPWQRRQCTAHQSTTRCSLHRGVPGPGLVVQASWAPPRMGGTASTPRTRRFVATERCWWPSGRWRWPWWPGRPTSGPLLKAVVWMLAILAVVVPVAVHATAASPIAPARPLDLHAVVTMLGAWAAWMAVVAPSSVDATTARNVSRSMLVASPSGYPAGWPSR